MGLISLVGTMLRCSLESVLNHVSVKNDLRYVLQGTESPAQREGPVSRLYRLVVSYENGDWEHVSELAQQLGLSETAIAETYLKSLRWAHQPVE